MFLLERILFGKFSLEEFDAFYNGDYHNCEKQSNSIFYQADVREAKGIGNTRQVNDRSGENQAEKHGTPKNLVVTAQLEHASALTAHVEGVEDFGHAHRQESHGHSVRAVGNFPYSALNEMTDKIGDHSNEGDHCPLIYNIDAQPTGKDSVCSTSGFSFH